MRLHLRLARASRRTLVWAAIFIAGAIFALLRTAVGHEVVLNWLVDQADGRVAGSIEVEGIRSSSLFQGATLQGVRLVTPEGDAFFTADSLRVSYRLRGLLTGDLSFADIRLWRPVLELAWDDDAEGSTLGRWAASPRGPVGPGPGAGDEADSGDGGPTLRFSDIRVVEGEFRLRQPTDLDPEGMVRVLPMNGGTLALDLALDSLAIPRLEIQPESAGGTRFSVRTLEGELRLLREVIPIRDLELDAGIAAGRLELDVDALDIPQGLASGGATVFLAGDGRRRAEMSLQVDRIDRDELDWLLPWLPPLTAASTAVDGTVDRGTSRWQLRDLQARWDGGRIAANGAFIIGGGTSLDELVIQAEALPVAALRTYVEVAADKPGALSGNLRLDGPVDALGVVGRMGIRHAGSLSTADLDGVIVPGDGELRLRDFEVFVAPFHWSVLEPWVPAVPVRGVGTARVVLNGAPGDGLRLVLEATRSGPGQASSRILAQGSVRTGDPGRWQVDVQGDVAPLQLDALAAAFPDVPLSGAANGSFRVSGSTDSLAVHMELDHEEAFLELDGTFSPADLQYPASLEVTANSFPLGRYLTPAGPRTRLTGTLSGETRGWGAEMVSRLDVALDDSNVRGVEVDSVALNGRVDDGRMVLDTVRALVGGVRMFGGGSLGLPDLPDRRGELALRLDADSLSALRPAFTPTVMHARDTLMGLDREILLLSGVDPDTLPLQEEITLTGSASGAVYLSGRLDDLDGSATLELARVGYRDYFVQGARIEALGSRLASPDYQARIALDTDSVRVLDRELESSRSRVSLDRTGARTSVQLVRSPTEDYALSGGIARDGDAWRADLDELNLRFDTLQYSLTAPTRIVVSDSAVAVDALELTRSGSTAASLALDGRLPQRGPADFTARVRGVALERVTRLLQVEDISLGGVVDLDLSVQGPAADPLIQGGVWARSLAVGQFLADSLDLELDYGSRAADFDLQAFRGDSIFLEGGGRVPVDLALRDGTDRILDVPMDVEGHLSSVPVAPILALLEDLEEVEGVVSGDFTVGGTLKEPIPEGIVRLEGGAWTVGALGVRQSDVNGTFTLTPDRSVAVNARARAGGRVDLSGEIVLSPITDPGLDVELTFQRFLAVDRRDVRGSLSGRVTVSGRYQQPVVTGSLTVDEGVIFLEEFQRAAGVVDLTDPVFLGLVDQEAFILPEDRPLLAGIRNPFLDQLRMDVSLAVPRATWLRSSEMNVEIAGDLDVTYDRPDRDLVLVGELLARRGQYSLLGRTFVVQGGSVSFIGVPGINPLLDIQAVAPIRTQEGGTLDIEASVEGTLAEPEVNLSSDEAGLAQSDLVSYLVLGRPSSEITSPGNNPGEAAGSTLVSAGFSAGLGTLASQLAALTAQQFNTLDYFSVTQVGDLGLAGGDVGSSFNDTQVELGWYFGGGDFFSSVVLRPLSTPLLGGARVEWQSSEQYHLEAFVEERFLRQGRLGLNDLTQNSPFTWGLAVFREWGY